MVHLHKIVLDMCHTSLATMTSAHQLLLLSFIFIVSYFYYLKSVSPHTPSKSNAKGTAVRTIYPPFIPFGRFEMMSDMSSEDCTIFLSKLMNLNGDVWRYRPFPLRLNPFAQKKMTFESFDANLHRQVFNDRLATKPVEVYGVYYGLHKGKYNLFSSEGPKWYHARKSIATAFSAQHIRRMNTVVKDKTEKWICDELNSYVDECKPIDIASEMLKLTLSIICEAAFQYNINEKESNMFLEELHLGLLETMISWELPLRKYFTWIIPSSRRAKTATNKLAAFCKKVLDNYRGLKSPIKGTIIDCIVNNLNYANDDERIADILMMLLGGHDTSAYTIAWTLLEVAKHPKEQQILRSKLKEAESSGGQLQEVEKLQHIIKESMRLNPVAAMFTSRVIASDLIVKREKNLPDYLIPNGSTVICSIFSLFRNPKYFKEPESFVPSRWENPSKTEADVFMPFTSGRRNCVGQSIANSMLRSIISRLCFEFDFAVMEEGTTTCFFTLAPKNMKLLVSRTV